jgi:sulfur carrier protein ThiS adenylyltransferase
MKILVNEREREVPAGSTAHDARLALQADADVLILNGAPARGEEALAPGDHLVLIRRGVRPADDELEALLVARHTPGVHARVRDARVGIAGLGGLGSAVAVALARMGVGTLVIADHDVVEPSNLNRQQYFVDQIGTPKARALAETLARVNPLVRVEPHEVLLTAGSVPGVFAGVGVLVEAFDRAEAKEMLVGAVLGGMPGVPLVAASGLAGTGPANAIVTRRFARNLWIVGDGQSAAASGVGLMAPRVGVAAHHQACAVLRLLLGEDPEG